MPNGQRIKYFPTTRRIMHLIVVTTTVYTITVAAGDITMINHTVGVGTASKGYGCRVEPKTLSVPFDECLRPDDDQYFPPVLPEFRQDHPEESISPAQLRSLDRAMINSQLLAEGKILGGKRRPVDEQITN
jgi:hypothetical protein